MWKQKKLARLNDVAFFHCNYKEEWLDIFSQNLCGGCRDMWLPITSKVFHHYTRITPGSGKIVLESSLITSEGSALSKNFLAD